MRVPLAPRVQIVLLRAALLQCTMAGLLPGQDERARPRPRAAVDSARAAALYVSNDPADHPVANYARAIAAKAATDSIFAARSAGVMKFSKVTYTSPVDGLEIPASLFEPLTARGPRTRPALVWVHGGVHGNWDQNYLPFIIEAVRRGYVIIAPDYRGSTGYGKAFHERIDYGGTEVDDVLASVQVLRANANVDTTRIGVMGWSHGGYITALLMMRHAREVPFRSGAAIVPVTNLLFRLSFKGPSYQRSFATQAGLRGLPFENRAEYVRRSPYYWVDSLRRPLLVHVATNDEDVNFEEARPLVDALVARKPHLAETKVYVNPTPGPASVGHTFSRRVNRVTLLREDSPEQVDSWNRVWAFFARTMPSR
ncbi:MAG: S9 family peptidase [Gemmatimonadaceae bacterium]|nr:S9 family peptidase [Gemmatimonadaceae bacterium]